MQMEIQEMTENLLLLAILHYVYFAGQEAEHVKTRPVKIDHLLRWAKSPIANR